MNLIRKIVAGGAGRKTRFHTGRNELIDLRRGLAELPRHLAMKLVHKATGRRHMRPWWPTAIVPMIEQRLSPDSVVLEFGSGGSTVWLSRRAGRVISIENHPEWADRVRGLLHENGCRNAEVVMRTEADYWTIPEGLDRIDLVIVDGRYRWRCVESALERIAPGGSIYLDNADAESDVQQYPSPGDSMLAQDRMLRAERTIPGARLHKVRSLATGELFASEGWILDIPAGG